MNNEFNRLSKALICGLLLYVMSVTGSISAAELRDPTRPADFKESTAATESHPQEIILTDAAEGGWKLNSTLTSGNRNLAIINGALVEKGDKVGNMVVVDIKPNKALLRVNNENVEVMLVRNSIKTKVNNTNLKK